MTLLAACLGCILLACLAALALRLPTAAVIAWILCLEAMPEFWLGPGPAPHEAVIAALKTAGIGLALLLAIRFGWRFDPFNPAFAFGLMFITGLAHGLYPGLGLPDSFRSLLGSAAPFLFGFVKLPAPCARAVIRATILAPLAAVAFGAVLQLAGIHRLFTAELGFRLTGPGEAPFLAGFALVAVYAGLLELSARPSPREFGLITVNFLILLLTGARAPLALAVLLACAAFLLPNPAFRARGKIMLLAAGGALGSLAVMFLNALSFLRIVGLAQAGQTGNLSNRGLTWPYFLQAIHDSPWVGWGVGAGKVVIPVDSPLSALIGTNAAHNEYLRIGAEGGIVGVALLVALLAIWFWRGSFDLPAPQRRLARLVILAFAIHSWTDNTLIATTSSVLFLWVAALFAIGRQPSKAAA